MLGSGHGDIAMGVADDSLVGSNLAMASSRLQWSEKWSEQGSGQYGLVMKLFKGASLMALEAVGSKGKRLDGAIISDGCQ